MCGPGDDIQLVAKTTGEVVKALAGESGGLEPVKAYAEYIRGIVHYRHYPKLVAQAMAAAEKMERSGLPRRPFSEISDPLLRAILVSAAEEAEPTMQQGWENLLANAVTVGPADVKRGSRRYRATSNRRRQRNSTSTPTKRRRKRSRARDSRSQLPRSALLGSTTSCGWGYSTTQAPLGLPRAPAA